VVRVANNDNGLSAMELAAGCDSMAKSGSDI